MWIWSVLGFYSIACADKPNGSIDPDTVMVRARCRQHLQNLLTKFPSLAGAKIIRLSNRDYRYRLVIPKATWIGVLTELAAEQRWSNFKSEVAKNQGKIGADYVAALHDVWRIMFRLQKQG